MSEQWTDWKRDVLDPLLTGPPGHVDTDAPVAILSADADKVQEYVFESARLPEIRGGSMLLQELNEKVAGLVEQAVAPSVGPSCVIYKGGGSLLAIVPDDAELLAELKHDIESLYPKHTGVATTTCVTYSTTASELLGGYGTVTLEAVNALRQAYPADWSRIAAGYEVYGQDGKPPGEISQKDFNAHRGFGQMVKLAGVALRCRKDGRPLVPFYEALPHAQRCRSCGLRPAVEIARYFGEEWPLCEPCTRKLEGWRELRSRWTQRFEKWLGEEGREELTEDYYAADHPKARGRPQDVDEIGQACPTRPGYIGFIYADGDRIGSLLESCGTPAAYKATSEALHRATRTVVFRALAELTCATEVKRTEYDEDGNPRPHRVEMLIHPFEIIIVGGDDVLLMVPGDVALPLAVQICELFGAEMAKRLPDSRPVTMSAGVVIADVHNPIRALRDVARQLLKSAKRRAHDTQAPALDFLVLKSQSMLRRDLKDLRSTYPLKLPGVGEGDALRLTGAPYTLKRMKILLYLLRQMRLTNFPASQLHRLVEGLHEGRERGSLFFLYQQARLHERETGAILQELVDAWHFEEKEPIPWNRVERDPDAQVKFTSILPDLADLYDFVPVKGKGLELWDVILKEVFDALSR